MTNVTYAGGKVANDRIVMERSAPDEVVSDPVDEECRGLSFDIRSESIMLASTLHRQFSYF